MILDSAGNVTIFLLAMIRPRMLLENERAKQCGMLAEILHCLRL